MNEHEFRGLAAAHALHALDTDEQRAMTRALAEHPEWQHILDEDLATAAEIGAGLSTPAPLRARSAILDAIADLPQQPTVAQSPAPRGASEPDAEPEPDEFADVAPLITERRSPSRARAGWFALAASLVVLVSLALTPAVRSAFTPSDPNILALEQVEAAADAASTTASFEGGELTLHWSSAENRAVLVATDMPGISAEQDFEMWLVRDEKVTSLGVMDIGDDQGGTMVPEGFRDGDAFAVTVEQQGGSPTGVATTDPILIVASA